MIERTYVVALDAREPAADASVLRAALKDNNNIKNWWNHLPYVYIVITDLNADALSADIWKRTKLRRFLVVEINLAESEGLLSDKAWNWIVRHSPAPAE
jgi:hypothetical protein